MRKTYTFTNFMAIDEDATSFSLPLPSVSAVEVVGDNETVINYKLKTATIIRPKKVKSVNYLRMAMVYHVLTYECIKSEKAYERIKAMNQKTKDAGDVVTDKDREKEENAFIKYHLLNNANANFKAFVSDYYRFCSIDTEKDEEIFDKISMVFAGDNFAKMYVLMVTGITKEWRSEPDSNGNIISKEFPIAFKGQHAIANAVHSLTAETIRKGKNSEEFKDFEDAVNNAFIMKESPFYDKVTIHYSINLVHDQLFKSSGNNAKHDAVTGGLSATKKSDFEIAKNAFAMMLSKLGVSFWGTVPVEKTIVTVDNIAKAMCGQATTKGKK